MPPVTGLQGHEGGVWVGWDEVWRAKGASGQDIGRAWNARQREMPPVTGLRGARGGAGRGGAGWGGMRWGRLGWVGVICGGVRWCEQGKGCVGSRGHGATRARGGAEWVGVRCGGQGVRQGRLLGERGGCQAAGDAARHRAAGQGVSWVGLVECREG